jgi:KipI family sensor histidine kinase inhibitor
MRALPAGDAAVLLDLTGGGVDAGQLAAAIGAADLPGVRDVVPGASTVLVAVEAGSWEPGHLARRLAGLRPLPPATGAAAPVVEFDVCYDGPDLADVATLTGLTEAEVIARHRAAEYRVGWLGFLPGFGYLTGIDPALSRVPRLDTPRLSVPAGSVAIAGGLAAIYPASSPGGWRVLGRTRAQLWDPLRVPPAVFAPGTRVRFRAVDDLPPPAEHHPPPAEHPPPPAEHHPPPADAGDAASTEPAPAREPVSGRIVEVLQPGPLTTIQDLGRPGFGHLGVPHSGAADTASLLRANALAGNEPGAAALEVMLGRLALRFGSDAVAAVTGAPAPLRLRTAAGTDLEPAHGAAFRVEAGAVLRLGSPAAGLRSYLAVDGGFAVAPVLGSRSADLLSGLGPAPLRAGDVLALGSRQAARPEPDPQEVPAVLPRPDTTVELRIIAGPRDDWFTTEALTTLTSGSYQVTAASNRTGLRLAGPPLRRRQVAELPSEGMATGSLQVSHDGQPILLLADHPTTGGYPVIAVVRAADIGLAAQLRPGQRVRFSRQAQ